MMENITEVIPEEYIWTSKYKWKLFFKQLTNVHVKSPKFSSGIHGIQDEWCFRTNYDTSSGLSILLHLESLTGIPELSVDAKLEILGSNEEKVFESSTLGLVKVQPGLKIDFENHLGSMHFILNAPKHASTRFTILIRIKIVLDPPTNYLASKTLNHECQLANDLSQAFESEKFADVTFKVGRKSFKALKGVLAVRSPVLAKMFEHETMEENRKNEVTISDIDEEVFQELLFFIYTDSSPNIEKMPIELLVAAEKYHLDRLKNWCEAILIKNTNSENVVGFFAFADTNNAMNLKKYSLQFILRHLKVVAQTEEFQAMKISHSVLFMEIFEAVAKHCEVFFM